MANKQMLHRDKRLFAFIDKNAVYIKAINSTNQALVKRRLY
ncbi:unnamed protein product [marine sediment metagenome]|uniref:Uncharacterized protein n=1 Tax=marine sediment metagenome TaxID=412755 RepID=X1PNS8_9ZZZZ